MATSPPPYSLIILLIIGFILVVLGILGFLPILGFWMIPLGLALIIVGVIWKFWPRRTAAERAAMANNTDVITTGDWVIVYLIMCIPLINIIMLFVWAFGGGTPASKANWAKATLIWFVIVFILTLLVLAAST